MKNTEIIVLLDRSGSMESVREDVISGFNAFLHKQRRLPGKASISLTQFSSCGIDVVYESIPVKQAPRLVLEPRGLTPLLDAIGETINRTKHRLLRSRRKVDQTIFVILTDGLENDSRKHTKASIREMINACQEDLKWEFVYLGANQDAFSEATSLGMKYGFPYLVSPVHTERVWHAIDDMIGNYRHSGEVYLSSTARGAMLSCSAPGYIY